MTVSHQFADEYARGIHGFRVPFVLMISLTAGTADAREIGPGLRSEPRCCSDRLVAAMMRYTEPAMLKTVIQSFNDRVRSLNSQICFPRLGLAEQSLYP